MKQTVSILFSFEKNFVAPQQTPVTGADVIRAWATICADALEARINNCKMQLFNNRERVTEVDSYSILYCTENGDQKRYSIPAATAMEEAIKCLRADSCMPNSKMAYMQLAKALYRISPKARGLEPEGYSFDTLYSYVLDKIAL